MTPENLAILSFDTPSAGGCLKAEQPMLPAWAGSVQISKQIEFFASFESRMGGMPGQVRAQARRSEHLTRVG